MRISSLYAELPTEINPVGVQSTIDVEESIRFVGRSPVHFRERFKIDVQVHSSPQYLQRVSVETSENDHVIDLLKTARSQIDKRLRTKETLDAEVSMNFEES